MKIKSFFAAPGEWIELDPDNRVSPPTVRDEKGKFLYYKPHCCRCNKPLNIQEAAAKGISYRSVEVSGDGIKVRNNPLGKDLIGSDCWKIITKK